MSVRLVATVGMALMSASMVSRLVQLESVLICWHRESRVKIGHVIYACVRL